MARIHCCFDWVTIESRRDCNEWKISVDSAALSRNEPGKRHSIRFNCRNKTKKRKICTRIVRKYLKYLADILVLHWRQARHQIENKNSIKNKLKLRTTSCNHRETSKIHKKNTKTKRFNSISRWLCKIVGCARLNSRACNLSSIVCRIFHLRSRRSVILGSHTKNITEENDFEWLTHTTNNGTITQKIQQKTHFHIRPMNKHEFYYIFIPFRTQALIFPRKIIIISTCWRWTFSLYLFYILRHAHTFALEPNRRRRRHFSRDLRRIGFFCRANEKLISVDFRHRFVSMLDVEHQKYSNDKTRGDGEILMSNNFTEFRCEK